MSANPASRLSAVEPAAGAEFDYEAALSRCARGDAAALQALYERESPRLLEPGQLFAISLEPAGGSPLGRPTGPVLFAGRVVAAR